MIQRAGEHMEKTRDGVIGSKHREVASSGVKEVNTGEKRRTHRGVSAGGESEHRRRRTVREG